MPVAEASRVTALDWLNFFLADVRGGVGAYIGVLLLTQAQWSQDKIGAVFTVSGVIGVLAHPSVGAFIDATHAKRALIVAGAFALSACGLAIVAAPVVPVVLASDIIMAILGGVFAPTVAAITLGLTAPEALPQRLSRNAAFDRAGNIFIAALFGGVGVGFSQSAPFFLAPIFAIATTLAVLSIPAASINHDRARGARGPSAPPADWRVLLAYRRLLVFAVAAALFHFANAPMLPLLAQKLSLAEPGFESGVTALAIIVAQLATIATTFLLARADAIGRRPLLILAFSALPLRGALCVFVNDPGWLFAVQILDGVGAGFFEALLPLILADLMSGTAHYSLARGFVGAIQGFGGSASQIVAGHLVATRGYPSAFLGLAVVATAALVIILVAMPETRPLVDSQNASEFELNRTPSRFPCFDRVSCAANP